MKEFMLLIRNQIDHQNGWSADRQGKFLNACRKYIDGLTQAGKLKSAQPLLRDGKMISGVKGKWMESPFHEGNEVIVGYYHVVADSIDDAIAIAKRNPEFEYSATARVEVRPIKTGEELTGYTYPQSGGR